MVAGNPFVLNAARRHLGDSFPHGFLVRASTRKLGHQVSQMEGKVGLQGCDLLKRHSGPGRLLKTRREPVPLPSVAVGVGDDHELEGGLGEKGTIEAEGRIRR